MPAQVRAWEYGAVSAGVWPVWQAASGQEFQFEKATVPAHRQREGAGKKGSREAVA